MINICFERNIKIYEFIFRLFDDGDICRLRIITWVNSSDYDEMVVSMIMIP